MSIWFSAEASKDNENIVDDGLDGDEDDDDYDDDGEIEINSGNELRDKDRIVAEEIDDLNNRKWICYSIEKHLIYHLDLTKKNPFICSWRWSCQNVGNV